MVGVYRWIMELLISRQLKFEEGEIELLGEYVLMVPVNFFVEATKTVIKNGKRAINDLYFSAWTAGYAIVQKFIERYHLHKFEERYKVAMDTLALAGIGDYKTLEFVPTKFSHFKVFKNPIAAKFYPSKEVVDHFLRGANAGGGTLVHERLINCVELDCEAINGRECEFINATEEVMKEKVDPKIIRSQLDLKYLIKKEQEFMEEWNKK